MARTVRLLCILSLCISSFAALAGASAPEHRLRDLSTKYEEFRRRYYSDKRNCDHCLPGWGLVSICDHTTPTECQPCKTGTWSPRHPHLKRCMPCSQCGQGLFEEYRCKHNRDTHCNSCDNPHAVRTADFIRKCTKTKTVGDQIYLETTDPLAKAREEMGRNGRNHGVPDDGVEDHEFWHFKWRHQDTDVVKPQVLPHHAPSDHYYNMQSSRLRAYRVKAYFVMGLSLALLVSTALLAAFLIRFYCCAPVTHHKVIPISRRVYLNLTDQDNEVIRQCAANLREKEGKPKKSKARNDAFESVEDDYWEEPINLHENPLDHYLFGSQEKLVPTVHHK